MKSKDFKAGSQNNNSYTSSNTTGIRTQINVSKIRPYITPKISDDTIRKILQAMKKQPFIVTSNSHSQYIDPYYILSDRQKEILTKVTKDIEKVYNNRIIAYPEGMELILTLIFRYNNPEIFKSIISLSLLKRVCTRNSYTEQERKSLNLQRETFKRILRGDVYEVGEVSFEGKLKYKTYQIK